MKFQTVFCIVKTSGLERYNAKDEIKAKYGKLSERIKNRISTGHENHYSLLERFKKYVAHRGIEIRFCREDSIGDISPRPNDLVISFGGDGTFLSCAQHFPTSPLLGINSDYRVDSIAEGSYGALTTVNSANFDRKLDVIFDNRYSFAKWHRLTAKLNGKQLSGSAVNEIFIGNPIAYESCDISIDLEGRSEDFLCSGAIFCTGMGSHAWFKAAGGVPFGNELNAFGFMVIMPNYKEQLLFSSGMLSSSSSIVIRPNRDNYILSFDSKHDTIKLRVGDKIEIGMNDTEPLHVLIPDPK